MIIMIDDDSVRLRM